MSQQVNMKRLDPSLSQGGGVGCVKFKRQDRISVSNFQPFTHFFYSGLISSNRSSQNFLSHIPKTHFIIAGIASINFYLLIVKKGNICCMIFIFCACCFSYKKTIESTLRGSQFHSCLSAVHIYDFHSFIFKTKITDKCTFLSCLHFILKTIF